jgi:hypothetical protein
MPTLNLGRVRFNWRGAYDPLVDYLEYDCVEDDGQSYVCIAPVTGTGPNDTGGGTYWGSMLIRSADYNAARDQAIQAASDASGSADAAATSEGNASSSATAAAGSMEMAERWASEDEDVEVSPGEYSAYHWSQKAAAFGDPNAFDITADQTADTRTTAEWMAQVLVNQQKNNDLAAVTATAFHKSDGSQPAWTAPTSNTLETASDLSLVVGSTIVSIDAGTAITLPTLSAGTDYTIYATSGGTLEAVDADSAAPTNSRKVGGFHARAGDGDINPRSCWDLNWKPGAPNPRGKTLSLDGQRWGEIYMCDHEYALYGYSRNGVQIADDGNRPIIPDAYGGDGATRYGSASWWVFNDVLASVGMRFPFYQEFTPLAYGVVERQAVGTDPGTTQHQAGHRSACGCEQITGVMYQWGADITGTTATGSASWNDWAEGRGDIYTNSIRAPRFGATWNDGSSAGSRASNWSSQPDNSFSGIGARGVCDHVNLQAER